MRGTWREAFFTGDPNRNVKYGSGNGLVSIGAAFGGTWRDALFLGHII